jgi:hypothetical protein
MGGATKKARSRPGKALGARQTHPCQQVSEGEGTPGARQHARGSKPGAGEKNPGLKLQPP